MMMSACEAGGLPIKYTNPSFLEGGFSFSADELIGHAVKVFIFSAYYAFQHYKDFTFKILYLERPEEERADSRRRRGMPDIDKDSIDYYKMMSERAYTLPHLQIDTMGYRDIVDNPYQEMCNLRDIGWPIDPKTASEDIISGKTKMLTF